VRAHVTDLTLAWVWHWTVSWRQCCHCCFFSLDL